MSSDHVYRFIQPRWQCIPSFSTLPPYQNAFLWDFHIVVTKPQRAVLDASLHACLTISHPIISPLETTSKSQNQMQRSASFEVVLRRHLVVRPTTHPTSAYASCLHQLRCGCPWLESQHSDESRQHSHLLPTEDQTLLHGRYPLLLLYALLYAGDLIEAHDVSSWSRIGCGRDEVCTTEMLDIECAGFDFEGWIYLVVRLDVKFDLLAG